MGRARGLKRLPDTYDRDLSSAVEAIKYFDMIIDNNSSIEDLYQELKNLV